MGKNEHTETQANDAAAGRVDALVMPSFPGIYPSLDEVMGMEMNKVFAFATDLPKPTTAEEVEIYKEVWAHSERLHKEYEAFLKIRVEFAARIIMNKTKDRPDYVLRDDGNIFFDHKRVAAVALALKRKNKIHAIDLVTQTMQDGEHRDHVLRLINAA